MENGKITKSLPNRVGSLTIACESLNGNGRRQQPACRVTPDVPLPLAAFHSVNSAFNFHTHTVHKHKNELSSVEDKFEQN